MFAWHLQDVDLQTLRQKVSEPGYPSVIVEEMCVSSGVRVSHIYAFFGKGIAARLYLRFEVESDESLARFRKHLMALPTNRSDRSGEEFTHLGPEETWSWWDGCRAGKEVYSWALQREPDSAQDAMIIIDASARRVFVWWVKD
jgi:hypothetical protein